MASTIKISGLDAILADTVIDTAMGFNTAGRFLTFTLYQGSIPTRSVLQTATNLNTFRQSDILYSCVLPNQSKPSQGIAGGGNFIVAAKTGTAAWFTLCGVDASNNIYGAVMGDVSDSSGNGQIILNTVSITQGWMYRVPNYLTALFPYSFSY